MTSKGGFLFRLRQCLCPDCLCPQSYFAEHDRACVSCRLGMHTPTREYPAPRSGESGIVVPATAVGHSRLIRRPDGEERPVATEDANDPAVQAHFDALRGWAPGEITEVFGK